MLPGVRWVSFTTREGRWIGAVLVDLSRTMPTMDAEELVALIEEV